MSYFQLFVKDGAEWRDDFGDRDRDCVEFERDVCGFKRKDTKIVKFARVPTMGVLNQTKRELNA